MIKIRIGDQSAFLISFYEGLGAFLVYLLQALNNYTGRELSLPVIVGATTTEIVTTIVGGFFHGIVSFVFCYKLINRILRGFKQKGHLSSFRVKGKEKYISDLKNESSLQLL